MDKKRPLSQFDSLPYGGQARGRFTDSYPKETCYRHSRKSPGKKGKLPRGKGYYRAAQEDGRPKINLHGGKEWKR